LEGKNIGESIIKTNREIKRIIQSKRGKNSTKRKTKTLTVRKRAKKEQQKKRR